MQRRRFIQIGIGAASMGLPINQRKEPGVQKKAVKGFVFSDAHIGWRGADQPSLQEQFEAIQKIKKRFPDLDIVFDTGDIHHGYLNEKERARARELWLSNIANQFPESLFHYVPGNHELNKGDKDTELTASTLGSINFRPYYSFDYRGIHFVSLPQLFDTILVSKESLQWLTHDLSINRDKTTLIFSHNSITGTTFDNGETAYRRVINSNKLLEVINAHSNVIAWFHGHNHQYEVVKKVERLYVSNGRIGGFNPPKSWGRFGQGNLGGVYFEVHDNGLVVRCFSATKGQFLDKLGYPNLSGYIRKKTSFNSSMGMNYYFGHGQALDNTVYHIKNHFLTSHNSLQVLKRTNDDPVINDNSNLAFTTELYFIGKRTKRLIGYRLLPQKTTRRTINEGLFVESDSETRTLYVELPSQKLSKNDFMVRGSYFRCESNDKFCLDFRLLPNKAYGSTKISVKFFVYSEDQEIMYESNYRNIEKIESCQHRTHFIVPDLYTKKSLNKYLKLTIKITNPPKTFVISKIALRKVVKHDESSLSINGKTKKIIKKLTFKKGLSSINQIKYRGKSASLLFKIENVKWQIRNAVANSSSTEIKISQYTHNFQKDREIVITPTSSMMFYVNITRHLISYTIRHETRSISMKLKSYENESQILVKHRYKPKQIKGAKTISHTTKQTLLKPISNNILVLF